MATKFFLRLRLCKRDPKKLDIEGASWSLEPIKDMSAPQHRNKKPSCRGKKLRGKNVNWLAHFTKPSFFTFFYQIEEIWSRSRKIKTMAARGL